MQLKLGLCLAHVHHQTMREFQLQTPCIWILSEFCMSQNTSASVRNQMMTINTVQSELDCHHHCLLRSLVSKRRSNSSIPLDFMLLCCWPLCCQFRIAQWLSVQNCAITNSSVYEKCSGVATEDWMKAKQKDVVNTTKEAMLAVWATCVCQKQKLEKGSAVFWEPHNILLLTHNGQHFTSDPWCLRFHWKCVFLEAHGLWLPKWHKVCTAHQQKMLPSVHFWAQSGFLGVALHCASSHAKSSQIKQVFEWQLWELLEN